MTDRDREKAHALCVKWGICWVTVGTPIGLRAHEAACDAIAQALADERAETWRAAATWLRNEHDQRRSDGWDDIADELWRQAEWLEARAEWLEARTKETTR